MTLSRAVVRGDGREKKGAPRERAVGKLGNLGRPLLQRSSRGVFSLSSSLVGQFSLIASGSVWHERFHILVGGLPNSRVVPASFRRDNVPDVDFIQGRAKLTQARIIRDEGNGISGRRYSIVVFQGGDLTDELPPRRAVQLEICSSRPKRRNQSALDMNCGMEWTRIR